MGKLLKLKSDSLSERGRSRLQRSSVRRTTGALLQNFEPRVLFSSDILLFPGLPKVDVGVNPRSIITGDFNGDGVTDLATANANSDDDSILLNNGVFGAPIPGDANNDGIVNLVDLDILGQNWQSGAVGAAFASVLASGFLSTNTLTGRLVKNKTSERADDRFGAPLTSDFDLTRPQSVNLTAVDDGGDEDELIRGRWAR